MRRIICVLVPLLLLLPAVAQNVEGSRAAAAPPMIKFSGAVENGRGTVGLTFALYASQTGGAPLWLETQNVTLDEQGRYTVLLGSAHRHGVPLALFAAGEARWIGVQVEGRAELPRVLLVSVPYSLSAANADMLGGRPASAYVLAAPGVDTTQNYTNSSAVTRAAAYISSGTVGTIAKFTSTSDVGDSIMTDSGAAVTINGDTIYAGTARRIKGNFNAPNHGDRLLYMNSNADASTIVGYMPSGTGHAAAVNIYGTSNATQTSVGQFRIDVNNWNTAVGDVVAMRSFGTCPFPQTSCTGGTALPISFQFAQPNSAEQEVMRILPNGRVGIGTTTPGHRLSVAGTVESTAGGFKFPDATTQTTAATLTGVTAGTGLTGGGTSGNVTVGADATYLQRRVGACPTGSVMNSIDASGTPSCATIGQGTVAATAPLALTAAGIPPNYTFRATQTGAGPAPPDQNPTPAWLATVPASIVGFAQPSSGVGAGVVGWGQGGASAVSVGVVALNSSDAPALFAYNTSTSNNATAVNAVLDGSGGGNVIEADATATTGTQTAGHFSVDSPQGTAIRLKAPWTSTSWLIESSNGFIVNGVGDVSAHSVNVNNGLITLNADGMIGANSFQNFNFSVEPNGNIITNGNLVVNGTGSHSFNGDVYVNGTLHKPAGSFTIDHPLDPANKVLNHSFVESPDMMNIYNGIVVLDKRGEAWVQLPEWFEALNREFRYQLTAIGAPGPKLYIAQKISGNRFKVAGGKRGMEVSWQVTGVRHDAFAEAHRIQVVEEKTGSKRGTYLHPELFETPQLAQK